MAYRPGGVTALAVIFIIIAALGVIGAIAIEAVIVAGSQNVIISNVISAFSAIYFIPYYLPYPLTPDELQFFTFAILLSTAYSISSSLSYIGYLHIATVIVLIGSVLYVIAAFGLLQMKNWGRILALIIGIFDIIVGAIGLIVIAGILLLILGILTVWYLFSDVKHEFE